MTGKPLRDPAMVTLSAVPLDGNQAAATEGHWIHILPAGTFMARDGRGPFNAGSERSLKQIVQRTMAYLAGAEMPIDYDHQSVFGAVKGVGGTAKAAGWIKQFEVRRTGIWGLVKWTAAATVAIRAGEYRYLSPVIITDKVSHVVLMVRTPGLVNSPALDLAEVAASAALTAEGTDMKNIDPSLIAKAAKLLGLPDDATEEHVTDRLAEVRALLGDDVQAANDAPDPAKFVPMSVFQEAVADANRLRQGMTEEAALATVEDHIRTGRLLPFLKDWAVNLCTINRPAFDAFVSNTGKALTTILEPQFKPRKLGADAGNAMTDAETEVCRNMGLTPEEFNKAREQR